MINKVREIFEQRTVPNFSLDISISRNQRGEYINPELEDHWQTFQEGFEAGLLYAEQMLDNKIEQHFGIK